MYRPCLTFAACAFALAHPAHATIADPIFLASFGAEPAALTGVTAAHNSARAEVGVAALFWDEGLAASAQVWANKCIDVEAPLGLLDHNANRSVGFPFYVGENIFGTGGAASGVDAVALWVAEKANYNHGNNTCNGVCGHYTQVVWSTTVRVGCAMSFCANLQFENSVVCDYGPGGNTGGPPY
jgi:pathogenesis-related protein 1